MPSEALLRFVAEAPAAREPHVSFLSDAAASLPRGSRVLDVGAGEAPYRELFAAHTYETTDWEGTQYSPAVPPDHVAAADALPLGDGVVDGLVCTQVLEHVPDPAAALAEFRRVLRPGGMLWVTTPLTWYLHEVPHDYYRFTSYGLSHLIHGAGFVDVEIRPMNDSPATIGQLLRHLGFLLGRNDDGHDARRATAGEVAAQLAEVVEGFGDLDTQWWLPISFAATARTPDDGEGPAAWLSGGRRSWLGSPA